MKYAKQTLEKIAAAEAAGAVIVENKNWRFNGREAGFARVEKLAQTNNRRSGYPERIIWACWK